MLFGSALATWIFKMHDNDPDNPLMNIGYPGEFEASVAPQMRCRNCT
jgi:hypothetical protein